MKFILMGLVKSFTKEMGRSPNVGELKLLRREADIIQQQDKIIPFPQGGKDKISPFKPRPQTPKIKQNLKDNPVKESIDPKRIKGGISTKIKLNSFRENQQYVKDLIGGKSKEFNTLKSKDRKEVLDQLEAQIKKGKTPPTSTDDMPFAMGGLAGLLGEGARVDLAYGGRTGFKKGSKKSLGSRAKELLLGNPDAIKYFGGIDVVDQMYQLLGLPGLYASGGRIGYAEGTPKTEKILAAEKMAREKNITVEQALQKIFEDANTEGRSKMAKGGLAELLGE